MWVLAPPPPSNPPAPQKPHTYTATVRNTHITIPAPAADPDTITKLPYGTYQAHIDCAHASIRCVHF